MDLSIIVLNWNTVDETRDCLKSISDFPPDCDYEVMLADNASEDGSREMVRTEFPDVTLVAHPINLGFCAGNNRAIPFTSGRYVFFLNSDTVMTPGALANLVRFADDHPEAGIIGPKLLNLDGSLQYSCRRYPDLGAGFFRNTPLGRLFPGNRYTKDYLMSDWDHATVKNVDWVSGAALLITREMLTTTGGFDEGFYMYCEDVDLCFRVHELGKDVLYLPDSVIYHIIGRSSTKVPTRMTYYFHRSMYRFYRKHYVTKTSIFIRPLIIPGLIARASGQILKYKWRNLTGKHTRGVKK
ncbi:MAG: glycosyltransferase family 2 protein [Chthonomonadales bacterium]